MLKYLIIYSFIFRFLRGSSVPISMTSDQKSINNDLVQTINNKLSQNVITEGGAIIPSNPIILLKDHPILLNSDDEFGQNKNKSVVGRKGVNYTHIDDVPNVDNIMMKNNSQILNETVTFTVSVQPNTTINDVTNMPNNTQNKNITRSHKPLVLSHEALQKMDIINNLDIRDDNIPNIKINSGNAGSHPALILPIVITILVVPMFAVVGYMALKRGQEAWKNRHYKRMDFLLDGMYNE